MATQHHHPDPRCLQARQTVAVRPLSVCNKTATRTGVQWHLSVTSLALSTCKALDGNNRSTVQASWVGS